MKELPRKSPGDKNVAKWDDMDFMERLNLIMNHADIFRSLRLITPSEIAMVDAMHESAREYIVEREDQPLFTSIHLKKTVATQIHRNKLKAALRAVFK
ncbi:hypothetical protein KJ662_03245 [Patescibacteria group bacterium]|nr:hypothetical protein [Patescibacteria group bacterium]